MGKTAPKIENAVKTAKNYSPENIRIIHAENMSDAVNKAKENAVPGDIVTMSPACASFDMYKNFAERGKHFKDLVNNL